MFQEDNEKLQKELTNGSKSLITDEVKEEENEDELKEELDYLNNDPVRKYQFTYNESLCMSHKYPEIEISDKTIHIEVAPGEGKKPTNVLQEIDWDVKSFPHIHNANGKNGKDMVRKSKLTEKNYFIQRVLNKDKRFARCPAYIYAAVAYLENKQLQSNINLSGTRGKQVNNVDGGISYQLEDSYAVLEDIRNTPRYWKKVKHEMIANLENLGAFQLFFTLSCADLRWEENFAAILRDQGLNLIYSVIQDEDGYPATRIQVGFKKDGVDKTLDLN